MDTHEDGIVLNDARQTIDQVVEFISKERSSLEALSVPPNLEKARHSSQEIVEACIDKYNLPKSVAEMFARIHPREYSADIESIRLLALSAKDTKTLHVDATTGLETTEVMRYNLAVDLRHALIEAKELTTESIPLSEAIIAVRAKLTDEYQVELDSDLAKIQSIEHPELQDDIEKMQASQDKLTRHILERNLLLSHMSTIAVGGSDIQGMKNTNTFFGLNPRSDMDYEEATNQLGIKKQGRTKQALTKITGNAEYDKTLAELDGDTVVVWDDEKLVEEVSGQYYEDRARSLVSSEDLDYIKTNRLLCTTYRRRIEAGDEGTVQVQKALKTADGRPVALNDAELKILEGAFRDASYVKVGEFTPEQSAQLRTVVQSYLGERTVLTEDTGNIPVYIQDRVALLRMDKAFKQSVEINSTEYQKLIANPELLIVKAVDVAFAAAGNTMEENKGDEPKGFLKAAINGDALAQVYLAQTHNSGRALANPRELVAELQRPPYNAGLPISDEEFEDLYPKVEHRQTKLTAAKKP
ncbi:MAG: hypothetical protein M3Q44_07205 [bacterium]|nr:hypothetical protein [bacterium]